MKVTVLGYWGGYPYEMEGTTSYLVESEGYHLLLDAGSSTLIQLEKHLNPLELDAVLVTHYHHDHIADLGVLQYLRQLAPYEGAKQVLPIYGHMEDTHQFNQLTMPGVSIGCGYKESDILEIGPFKIEFIRTVHPVPCFAVRIKEISSGKVFVFTADTGYFSGLTDFCHKADLLITDTYLLSGNEGHHAHLTTKETGNLASNAQVRHLVLSHLNQHVDLNQVLSETQYYAGIDIPITLATTHLEITL